MNQRSGLVLSSSDSRRMRHGSPDAGFSMPVPYYHLQLMAILQVNLGQLVLSWILLLWKRTSGNSGTGFFTGQMSFLSPAISVIALKGTRSTNPNQWPFSIHQRTPHRRSTAPTEGALLLMCQLSNTITIIQWPSKTQKVDKIHNNWKHNTLTIATWTRPCRSTMTATSAAWRRTAVSVWKYDSRTGLRYSWTTVAAMLHQHRQQQFQLPYYNYVTCNKSTQNRAQKPNMWALTKLEAAIPGLYILHIFQIFSFMYFLPCN